MNTILSSQFLFRFAFPVQRAAAPARKKLTELGDRHVLPNVGSLDQVAEGIVTSSVGWDEAGLTVQFDVGGKPVPRRTSRVNLFLDMRPSRKNQRATRYCCWFACNLTGDHKDVEAAVVENPIPLAMDPAVSSKKVEIQHQVEGRIDGFRLGLWFPAERLPGYDPAATRQLGFAWLIEDSVVGNITLGADSRIPIHTNPSLWQTLELVD